MKMINIVEDAEEAAVVKSLSKALSEEAEESKADGEGEGKRTETFREAKREGFEREEYNY